MGVKLMTGATGEQNIQAADDRECLAGITGLDSYVFPTGSQLKATLVDANTITIGTGAGSLQGSRFRCSTTTTINIQSGTQGQFRHDIIVLHFSRETSGREGLEFQVLTGEPAASEGAATDPAYTAGDLLKGDAEAFMPLYRVKLSGINAADPEPMFSVLTPLATLGDSVSRAPKGMVARTKVAVPGFSGNLVIEYGLLGGGTDYNVDKALYVRLYGYLWAWFAASGTGPWDKCVKAPSGSTRWCLKVPFKATTGKAADWSIESECLSLQSDNATDNVGYFTFVSTSSKRVFSANDGYIYVEMYDEKPPNAPVTLLFDTTLPVMRA